MATARKYTHRRKAAHHFASAGRNLARAAAAAFPAGGTADFAERTKEANRTPDINEIASAIYDLGAYAKYMNLTGNPHKPSITVGDVVYGGHNLYDRMESDAHLWSVKQTRALAAAGMRITILPNPRSGTAKGERDAELVRDVIYNGLRFNNLLEICEAIFRGYSVSEIMWARDGATWAVDRIKGRKPSRFVFDTDGNLRLVKQGNAEGELMPPLKFWVHSYYSLYENRYGNGVFNHVYWDWWFKHNARKDWAVFMNKYAMPSVIGKYKPGTSTKDQNNLLSLLRYIQSNFAAIVPDSFEYEYFEAERHSTNNTYDKLAEFSDKQMSKGILGQTMTTDDGASQSQATVHDRVRDDLLDADCKSLESSIDWFLIKAICWYNGIEDEPYCKLEPADDEELAEAMEIDKGLVEIGLPMTTSYYYERYGRPEPAAGDELVTPPARAQFSQAQGKPADFAEATEARRARDAAEYLLRRINNTIDNAVPDAAKLYESVRGRVQDALEGAGSFDAALAALGNLDLAPTARRLLLPFIRRAALAGADADADIITIKRLTDAPTFAESLDWDTGLTPDEALAWWSEKIPASETALTTLEAWAQEKVFTVAGLENEYLLGRLKHMIAEAMEQGIPYGEWYTAVDEMFIRAGVAPLKPWHLETVLRTNMMEAYNRGHHAVASDPDVVAEFPGYEHIAIEDSRTRPEHSAWDGYTAPRADAHWNHWFFTWGDHRYNCRCTFIPATQAEINAYQATQKALGVENA